MEEVRENVHIFNSYCHKCRAERREKTTLFGRHTPLSIKGHGVFTESTTVEAESSYLLQVREIKSVRKRTTVSVSTCSRCQRASCDKSVSPCRRTRLPPLVPSDPRPRLPTSYQQRCPCCHEQAAVYTGATGDKHALLLQERRKANDLIHRHTENTRAIIRQREVETKRTDSLLKDRLSRRVRRSMD